MTDSRWPSAVVALGVLALIGIVLVVTLPRAGESSANFLEIWAAIGTLVGVAVGAIPSYFFSQKANKKENLAEAALAALDPNEAKEIKTEHG
jgi:hypothetical protein